MAYYKIIKGWPGEHTLDYQFTPDSTTITLGVCSIVPGTIFCVSTDGTAIVGTYNGDPWADAGDFFFFCFDVDSVTSKVMGIPGNIIVEVDSDSYVAGTYAPATPVTCTGGKFDEVLATSKKTIGYVLSHNAVTGYLQILMREN